MCSCIYVYFQKYLRDAHLCKYMMISLPMELMPHAFSKPLYKTAGAACMDIYASNMDDVVLGHACVAKIPTGLKMDIPEGMECQIRCRSGLASKGIMLANGCGCVDSDYKKEVFVLLYNGSKKDFIIQRGMRIAQMKMAAATHVQVNVVKTVQDTTGRGGFGSTGC